MKVLLFLFLSAITCNYALPLNDCEKKICIEQYIEKYEKKYEKTFNNITKNSTECDICEVIVNIIDAGVKEGNETLKDIEKIIEDLCRILGGKLISKECNFIIDDINDIINWILDGYDPKNICQKLKLCPSTQISNITKNNLSKK